MQEILKEKLRSFLVENNPDLLLKLNGDKNIRNYIEDKVILALPIVRELQQAGKPAYIIEEECMALMTEDLRPSRFNFLKEILETEFPDNFQQFKEAGVLTYEVVNMVERCNTTLDDWKFSEENEDDRFLRYAIIAEVHDYLLD